MTILKYAENHSYKYFLIVLPNRLLNNFYRADQNADSKPYNNFDYYISYKLSNHLKSILLLN